MRVLFHRGAVAFISVASGPRFFQVLQKGFDTPGTSLFRVLGLEDGKRRQIHGGGLNYADEKTQYSAEKLQQAFFFEASKLKDPLRDPNDKKKLEEMKSALRQLLDARFHAQYTAHHASSNDARLHILQDGGEAGANFNPEHQQFSFVDHSKTVKGAEASSRPLGEASNAEAFPPGRGDATVPGSRNAAPRRGEDIAMTLQLSFEEGWFGGTRQLFVTQRDVTCPHCSGSGKATPPLCKGPSSKRRCTQCCGRGTVVFPSGTYHLSRPCRYCNGEGATPPRPCSACAGSGVLRSASMRSGAIWSKQAAATGSPPLPVFIPPRTLEKMNSFRLGGKGHAGRNGGGPGDIVLTVIVCEHRYFHYDAQTHSLHFVLPITLSTALLGGTVKVPGLASPDSKGDKKNFISVYVPPGAFNGQQLRVVLKGSETGGIGPATLVVHLLVMVPTGPALTRRQRVALQVYEGATTSCPQSTEPSEGVDGCKTEVESGPRTDLLSQCAALKSRYKHWLS